MFSAACGNATRPSSILRWKAGSCCWCMALQADGRTIEGDPILVVDSLGAGRGEMVMITSDGIGARELLGSDNSPVRWSVLGIRRPMSRAADRHRTRGARGARGAGRCAEGGHGGEADAASCGRSAPAQSPARPQSAVDRPSRRRPGCRLPAW